VLRDGKYIATKNTQQTSRGEIVSLMVGRQLQDFFVRPPRAEGQVVLAVHRLGRKGAFSDVSFQLRHGEILGLYGLKGAGRSELARVIFGLDRRDSGEILLEGARVEFRSAHDAIRHRLGLIPEDRKTQGLFPNMDVKENASLVSLDDLSRSSFLKKKEEQRLVGEYIQRLQIRTLGQTQPILDLSGGNQQKVILARWLAIKPRVLILDEPTAGIDVGAKAEIYRLMAELAAQGLGLILISSELPEVLAVSDRILVMHEGRLVAEMDAVEASEERIMRYIHSSKEEGEEREPVQRARE
jgi:rhamnose transport system ATP-binding protein